MRAKAKGGVVNDLRDGRSITTHMVSRVYIVVLGIVEKGFTYMSFALKKFFTNSNVNSNRIRLGPPSWSGSNVAVMCQ